MNSKTFLDLLSHSLKLVLVGCFFEVVNVADWEHLTGKLGQFSNVFSLENNGIKHIWRKAQDHLIMKLNRLVTKFLHVC